MTHKLEKELKKIEIFTSSMYATLASTLKIPALNFSFWSLFLGLILLNFVQNLNFVACSKFMLISYNIQ